MSRPWYINTIRSLYCGDCQTNIKVGSTPETEREIWVKAVPEPYTAGSLKAAWEVLMGRAFAFEWPKAGDLEYALHGPYKEPKAVVGTLTGRVPSENPAQSNPPRRG